MPGSRWALLSEVVALYNLYKQNYIKSKFSIEEHLTLLSLSTVNINIGGLKCICALFD